MGKKEEIKKEDVVQAVVVADSFHKKCFNTSFAPLTKDCPSCMLPLAGRPLLEYTLQCLSMSGVQDVIIYLTTNSAKVKSWLKSSPWDSSYPAAPFTVNFIVNEDCRSFGDAMRDLYDKGILRHDFILVSGDLISNMNLAPYLARHKEAASKDKKAIMTAIYTKGSQGNPLRSKGSELVLATDRATNQMLYYQTEAKSTLFPIDLFQHDEVDVYFDVLDSNVYICSPIVLALFSDNFDIQDMNRMLIEIIESELIDSTIYIQISNSEFSSRAMNPYLYNTVLHKILNRWLYPIVPERRMMSAGDEVCQLHNSVYKSSAARVARGSNLGRNTFVAHSVKIGSSSTVQNSDLEQGVSVGDNCNISGSIIMKNTRIGDGCKLTECIVGENVEIPDNCEIKGKVVIGHNCVLRSGVVVPPATRVSCEKTSDGFSDDENEEGDAEEGEFGPKAFNFAEEEEIESDDEDVQDDHFNNWGEVYLAEDEDSESSDEGEDDDSLPEGELSSGEEDMDLEEEEQEHHDVKNFKREVLESLQRAESEGKIVTDNLVLEINSSKHAWNTTLCEVNQCVLESVLTLNVDLTLPPAKLLGAVKANLSKFKDLLVKYSKSKSGQEYYLDFFPELVNRFPTFMDIVAKVLHILYELDVLSEDPILKWAAKLQDNRMKTKISGFLDWLQDDEDESSEEESSDDE